MTMFGYSTIKKSRADPEFCDVGFKCTRGVRFLILARFLFSENSAWKLNSLVSERVRAKSHNTSNCATEIETVTSE